MDEGFNKEIEYEIANGDPEGVFAIDAVFGLVTLQKPLDFEKTQRFELSVTVRDRGNPSLSSTANITVDILDVNDNKPEFEFLCYHGSIRAHDADSGINQELEYFIVHSDQDFPFYIIDGDIKVERGIGRQNRGHVLYTFDVIVQDKGKPPLSSTTHVRIYVLPVVKPLEYAIYSDSNSFLFMCIFGMFFFIILLTSI
ncbi:hypothetical protein FSP39_017193 [Pinctada imbricata]|uniref:Cadherin domain-containing protein n=1 Tax=Pinctada imbricata TaxID=66713 RepID=A0AA89CE28_PINIB|nr:hypothetical protein FSP39_017193 [Pinctada imbricata]